MSRTPSLTTGLSLPDMKVLGYAAFVVIILAAGHSIPIPGLALDSLPMPGTGYIGSFSRFSIFALAVHSLFSVLIIADILRLIAPRLADMREGSAAGSIYLTTIAVFTLALSAIQGYAALTAIDAYGGLVRTDAVAFYPVGVATFVGGAAVVLWLALSYRVPNMENGFWLVLAASQLMPMVDEVVLFQEVYRSGHLSVRDYLLPTGWLVFVIIATVFTNLALNSRYSKDRLDRAVPVSILLWPGFIASVLAGYIIGFLRSYGAEQAGTPDYSINFSAVLVMLIPPLVYLYARRSKLQLAVGGAGSATPILILVALVQILVFAGPILMFYFSGSLLTFAGSGIFVLTTVIMNLLSRP